MRMSWNGGALALALFGLLAGATPAFAAEPIGTWATENGRSHVRISSCGGAVCGSIVWLKEPNDPDTGKPKTDKNNADEAKRARALIGTPIVLSMKPNGADKWSGEVYNAENGKTYQSYIKLKSPDMLRIEGCVFGFLCGGEDWTRTKLETQAPTPQTSGPPGQKKTEPAPRTK